MAYFKLVHQIGSWHQRRWRMFGVCIPMQNRSCWRMY